MLCCTLLRSAAQTVKDSQYKGFLLSLLYVESIQRIHRIIFIFPFFFFNGRRWGGSAAAMFLKKRSEKRSNSQRKEKKKFLIKNPSILMFERELGLSGRSCVYYILINLVSVSIVYRIDRPHSLLLMPTDSIGPVIAQQLIHSNQRSTGSVLRFSMAACRQRE